MKEYVISYNDGEYYHEIVVKTHGGQDLVQLSNNKLDGGDFTIEIGTDYEGTQIEIEKILMRENS